MVPCEAALLGILTATFQLCPYVSFLPVPLDRGPALRSSFNLKHLLKGSVYKYGPIPQGGGVRAAAGWF